jgi:hypothetical protein
MPGSSDYRGQWLWLTHVWRISLVFPRKTLSTSLRMDIPLPINTFNKSLFSVIRPDEKGHQKARYMDQTDIYTLPKLNKSTTGVGCFKL